MQKAHFLIAHTHNFFVQSNIVPMQHWTWVYSLTEVCHRRIQTCFASSMADDWRSIRLASVRIYIGIFFAWFTVFSYDILNIEYHRSAIRSAPLGRNACVATRVNACIARTGSRTEAIQEWIHINNIYSFVYDELYIAYILLRIMHVASSTNSTQTNKVTVHRALLLPRCDSGGQVVTERNYIYV